MLVTTDAIVLSLQPLSDKAHLLHAYTRTDGRVNYRVYGLGRKHAIGLYAPFSIIRITADLSPSKPPTLKEAVPLSYNTPAAHEAPPSTGAHPTHTQTAYPSDLETVYKNTIRLFLCEVLFHVLRHPMPDEPMFDFLADSVRALDSATLAPLSAVQPTHHAFMRDLSLVDLTNFHLQFLADFAAKLGFEIESSNPLSSLQGKVLCPIGGSADDRRINKGRLPLTRSERQQALRALCDYFAEHVDTWQPPKSLDILMEVFD